jgi:hypothetical protein
MSSNKGEMIQPLVIRVAGTDLEGQLSGYLRVFCPNFARARSQSPKHIYQSAYDACHSGAHPSQLSIMVARHQAIIACHAGKDEMQWA